MGGVFGELIKVLSTLDSRNCYGPVINFMSQLYQSLYESLYDSLYQPLYESTTV